MRRFCRGILSHNLFHKGGERMSREETGAEAAYGITIDHRARAAVTGVENVESFDEKQIVLHTAGGELVITGSGLHVESLQLEEGKLTLTGRVDAAAYGSERRARSSFFRRALGQ